MRAFVYDGTERTVAVESVRRNGNVLVRGDAQYANHGITWAWRNPPYPRWIWYVSFIPFAGPFLHRKFFMSDTMAILATGIPANLEIQDSALNQSMTDEQARSIMIAHSEAMSIGDSGMPSLLIVALASMFIAGIAIVALFAGR